MTPEPVARPSFEALMLAIDFALHARLRVDEANAKRSTKAGTAESVAWSRILDALRAAAASAPREHAALDAARAELVAERTAHGETRRERDEALVHRQVIFERSCSRRKVEGSARCAPKGATG